MPSGRHVLEKVTEEAVVRYAEWKGVQAIKLNLQGNRGWPDRMFLYKGSVLFIEFKREGKELEPLQEFRLNWLEANGFNVGWCDNQLDGKRLIDKWLKSLTIGATSHMSRSRPTT